MWNVLQNNCSEHLKINKKCHERGKSGEERIIVEIKELRRHKNKNVMCKPLIESQF